MSYFRAPCSISADEQARGIACTSQFNTTELRVDRLYYMYILVSVLARARAYAYTRAPWIPKSRNLSQKAQFATGNPGTGSSWIHKIANSPGSYLVIRSNLSFRVWLANSTGNSCLRSRSAFTQSPRVHELGGFPDPRILLIHRFIPVSIARIDPRIDKSAVRQTLTFSSRRIKRERFLPFRPRRRRVCFSFFFLSPPFPPFPLTPPPFPIFYICD